jgi:hypothetical protein
MRGKLAWFGLFVLGLGLVYGGLNIAGAAVPGGVSGDVTVQNTATNPVPVSGSVTVANTPSVKIDPSGNAVQLSGTADVNVKNSSLTVAPPSPITGGGGSTDFGTDSSQNGIDGLGFTATASAIDIHVSSNVGSITITDNGHSVFEDNGPGEGGNATVQLALTRPIQFDTIECDVANTGTPINCSVGWVGDTP